MTRINQLRISWAVVLATALIAGTGCRQQKADIRVVGKATDGIRTPGASSSAGGPEMRVVTGEPVMKSDGGGATDNTTAEDKLGAVAVKVQY